MTQKPDKNSPAQAERPPATGAELAWIAVLVALCLMANSWIMGAMPEQPRKPIAAAVAQPQSLPAIAAPERPSRDRPSLDRERPWRDPSSSALPGF